MDRKFKVELLALRYKLHYDTRTKGGDCVNIRLNKEKLDKLMHARSFNSYQEIGAAAKERELPLAWRTIYTMVDGGNWRKESLEALCVLLECKPADIIDGWSNGESGHTHASPQPEEELEATPT